MLKKQLFLFSLFALCLSIESPAQHTSGDHPPSEKSFVSDVEPQPLLAQAIRLNDALSYLGSSLSQQDTKRLRALQDSPFTKETSKRIQAIL
ncbi:MAG: hypothetical protein ICV66_08215, partial [Chitinophagaceae bacterium]|nr:hypothetical protein [Chitinophagaceae bacterium]